MKFSFLFNSRWVHWSLRIILGTLFIYVGYARLQHPHMVAEHLMILDLLPWGLINFFAMWMLCFEVFIGMMIILGIWLRASSIILIGFCILCICLISYALIKDISMHCGCFITTPSGSPRVWDSLWQEGAMLLGCIWLFITTRNIK
jgi:uncharacterized membrane protein YphA (DoxX/SURF4 family)